MRSLVSSDDWQRNRPEEDADSKLKERFTPMYDRFLSKSAQINPNH